jgi:hypothetical protein
MSEILKNFVSPKSLFEIGHNARLKKYPDGTCELLVCDTPIFGTSGWERTKSRKRNKDEKQNEAESVDRSIRRARQQLRDYALCNSFSFFVTLTLDQKKINRYDITEITEKLRVWLDNKVRRNGLKYVLVPELHKDGAVHFHGFFNDALPVVDSGVRDGSGKHKVYNLPSWKFGFTTAIELYGNYKSAVSYVCKYIGKSTEKIGGRWYYSGGDLSLPEVEFFDVEIETAFGSSSGSEFTIPNVDYRFVAFKD